MLAMMTPRPAPHHAMISMNSNRAAVDLVAAIRPCRNWSSALQVLTAPAITPWQSLSALAHMTALKG